MTRCQAPADGETGGVLQKEAKLTVLREDLATLTSDNEWGKGKTGEGREGVGAGHDPPGIGLLSLSVRSPSARVHSSA